MAIPHYTTTDWAEHNEHHATLAVAHIHTEFSLPIDAVLNNEPTVRHKAANELVTGLLPHIRIERYLKAEDPYSEHYRAAINIVKPGLNTIRQVDGYIYDDQHFTEYEVQSTLINQYPERFI